MTCLEIPDIDAILAPRSAALCFKHFATITKPDLFLNGFWNLMLFISRFGSLTFLTVFFAFLVFILYRWDWVHFPGHFVLWIVLEGYCLECLALSKAITIESIQNGFLCRCT